MFKLRLLICLLSCLYLGFFIGHLSAPKEIQYIDFEKQPSESWAMAWEKSQNLDIRAHLIIEGLWSDEDKLVEIVFRDRGSDLVIGYAMQVQKKPGSVWNYDIGWQISTWIKPTNQATLVVRSIKAGEYTYLCGYNRFRFEYKDRPKED